MSYGKKKRLGMEWFKHSTGSHEDPDISDAWDQFGDAGPAVFWTILEVFGAEYSHLKDGWLTLSVAYFERKTRRKFRKSENILEFFQKRERIFFKKDQISISITIPKFIKIASNWITRQQVRPTPLPTEAPTEAPHAIEEEEKKKRREEEYKHPIPPKKRGGEYSDDFLCFWNAYPKKVKKPNAFLEWKKLRSRPPIDEIVECIERQKTWRPWIEGYIPDPERWLKNERWSDEEPPKGGNGNGSGQGNRGGATKAFRKEKTVQSDGEQYPIDAQF